MPAPRESAMLARAARMYYLENRPQSDIARELGVSRSNVSRILTAAREAGVLVGGDLIIDSDETPEGVKPDVNRPNYKV